MKTRNLSRSLAAGGLCLALAAVAVPSSLASDTSIPAGPGPAPCAIDSGSFTPAELEALNGLRLAVMDRDDPAAQPAGLEGWDPERVSYTLEQPGLVVALGVDGLQGVARATVRWYDQTGASLPFDEANPDAWLPRVARVEVSITGLVSGASRTYAVSRPDAPMSDRVAVCRLFNPYMTAGTTHLFTTDKTEYDSLVRKGWKGEDVVFYAPAAGARDSVPVYRLYNQWDGSHHFTTDPAEKDRLVKLGWTLEPSAWAAPKDGDARVYRLYNPYTGEHLFTTDRAESDRLASLGWRAEESGFSVYRNAQ